MHQRLPDALLAGALKALWAGALWVLLAAGCAPRQTTRVRGFEPARSTAEVLNAALDPQRHALLVGVDRYADRNFGTLRHAAADAAALGDVFADAAGGGFDTVTVLSGQAEREAILAALRTARAQLSRADVLVVYFSGHGTRVPDGAGGWRHFLLASDSRAADLEGTAIDLSELTAFMRTLRPERKAVILDVCFNGDGKSVLRPEHRGQGSAPGLAPGPTSLAAGEAHLYATTAGRPALEDDELGHGVYTWYLLEALGWGFAEADRDGDGVVTAWEAHDHARVRTLAHTDGLQVPEASFRVVGELDVVLAGRPDRRRERDRALVYLYAGPRHRLTGAELSVDGRSRGALPGTVAVQPGRHHLALTAPAGQLLAEGYLTLAEGQAYRAEDLTRLLRGPRYGIAVRPVVVASPPFRDAMGGGASGMEVALWHRDDTAPGRGQYASVWAGAAGSPRRGAAANGRAVFWTGLEGGYQSDWRRLRYRLGLGLGAVVMPPDWYQPRPADPDPVDFADQAGFLFGTLGPSAGVGWVLSEVWSLQGTGRAHGAWIDPTVSGKPRLVPWLTGSVGVEAVF